MASGQAQVSAFISDSTKDALEQYAEAHGLKKAFLIEEALLHHLQALRELPFDVIIPARLVVSSDSGQAMLERVTKPAAQVPGYSPRSACRSAGVGPCGSLVNGAKRLFRPMDEPVGTHPPPASFRSSEG